jgi:hypothetical protein
MCDNTHNLTLDVLKQIQAEMAALRTSVELRFDRIEEINRKQRRDSAGMLVMMRATAGDFDERVAEVEERGAALENAERRS